VNVVCALILSGAHDHGHAHAHGPGRHHDDHNHNHASDHAYHGHGAHDLNLRAAYLHVVADAATSLLAIVALLGGMLYGWDWLDPLMGIVGAVLVARWSVGLIRDTGRVLLDREMDHPVVTEIRQAIAEKPGWAMAPEIVDLHVWRVGREKFAVIVSLVTEDTLVTAEAVRELLGQHEELVHVSVEINRPPGNGDLSAIAAAVPHPASP
jgi:cation diffusion facilitator family transporter